MYDRVVANVRVAVSHFEQVDDSKEYVADLQATLEFLRGRKFSVHAKWFLDTQKSTTASAPTVVPEGQTLYDNQSSSSTGPDVLKAKLVAFPPDFEVGCCS